MRQNRPVFRHDADYGTRLSVFLCEKVLWDRSVPNKWNTGHDGPIFPGIDRILDNNVRISLWEGVIGQNCPLIIVGLQNMKQSIKNLTADQQSIIDEWVDLGMDIMAHYGIQTDLSIYQNLDSVYKAWVADNGAKPSNEEIVSGLGTIFGSRLSRKHETQWVMVVDEYGTDYALVINGYQIYPLDFVAKRIATIETDDPEFGFFSGMDTVIDKKFR